MNHRKEMKCLIQLLLEMVRKNENGKPKEQKTDLEEQILNAQKLYDNKEICLLVAGETKAGKSSLTNNIIGEDICTIDAGICTNNVTIIKYGEVEKITVLFDKENDDEQPSCKTITRDEMHLYASEKHNKNNKKKVRAIIVELPNELLKKGLVIIDTPGMGALNPLHTATTFAAAPKADIIMLVASADGELTTTEMEFTKQLLEVSKCNNLVHVLTNADSGSPEVVMEKNIKHLKENIDLEKTNLQCCMVSNTNYKKYRNKESDNKGGFDTLLDILGTMGDNVETLLAKKTLDILTPITLKMKHEAESILKAAKDPKEAEEIIKKRKKAVERLKEIKDHEEDWRIFLNKEIKNLNCKAMMRVNSDFDGIRTKMSEKLELDEYITKPDKLGSVISAEASVRNTNMMDYLKEELAGIYLRLKEESGLDLMDDNDDNDDNEGHTIDGIKVKKPKIGTLGTYRINIGTRVAIYPLVTTVIGAAIGGIVGTVAAPGPGTVIAAKIGAAIGSTAGAILSGIVGGIVGWFKSRDQIKQRKRERIKAEVEPKLRAEQEKYRTFISITINEAEAKLKTAFHKELDSKRNQLNNEINNLHQTLADRTKMKAEAEEKVRKANTAAGIIGDILSNKNEQK